MAKIGKKQIISFILSVAVMFVLYGIKQENAHDRYFLKVNLDKQPQQELVIDMGKQGLLKRLLQPNKMTIYLTCKTKAKDVSCSIENIDCLLSQSSKKGPWKELPKGAVLEEAFGTLPLNMEITLPKEYLDKYLIDEGRIRFYSHDKLHQEINLKFIDSRNKEE